MPKRPLGADRQRMQVAGVPCGRAFACHGIAGRGGHHLCTAFRHRAEWGSSSVSKQHHHGFLWFNAVFSAELLTLSHQNMPGAGLAVAPAVIWLQGFGCAVYFPSVQQESWRSSSSSSSSWSFVVVVVVLGRLPLQTVVLVF